MVEPEKMSKEKLSEEFSRNPEKYYKVKIFEEQGFERKRCKICGRYFWTADPNRTTCGDSSHNAYSFFKEQPRKIGYVEFWKRFEEFFRKNGHAIVSGYPVVSRWRQDLYFTIAGIQDFQRIENGTISFEYPANPLLVPQQCLRFNDIENVGITGRHFTSFMMANQTAFDWPNAGYWKDRTIELNYKFLTEVLEIKKEDIVYHEDVWAMPDFSAFGPSLETFSKGLEIVNNVFTEFGIANNQIKELRTKVVDVGWGFERALWYYTGYSNIYDAAFGSVIEKVAKENGIQIDNKLYAKFAAHTGSLDVTETSNINKKIEELLRNAGISKQDYAAKIRPMQELYAIVDHAKTLLFAINDGALPSNIGGGYNLRVIFRRAVDFSNELKLRTGMTDIARLVAEELEELYPGLSESLDIFEKVEKVEKERYASTLENARKIAETTISKGGRISADELKTLYESHGVTPEMLEETAQKKGISISLPENMYSHIITNDLVKKEKKQQIQLDIDPESLPATEQLYYNFATEAKARVLYSKGRYVILDKTPFYPEGGGQAPDTGYIDGEKVTNVQKVGKVIVHILENEHSLELGKSVEAKVDEGRRNKLIAHHTATHLISAAARKILGKHAWQEGARKEPEKAHIDIAHYEKLDEKEIIEIENLVNSWLRSGIKVNAETISRGEAESKYGFSIYQGHGVPAKEMRIVTITSLDGTLIDAEACGGLHAVGREQLIGLVKIINSYRIHDGVDRIEFVAGEAALEYFQKEHKELKSLSTMLNAETGSTELRLRELLESSDKRQKQTEKAAEALAKAIAIAYKSEREIKLELDVPRDLMVKVGNAIVRENENAVVLISNREGKVICMAGTSSGISAVDYAKSKISGFVGGGSQKFAEGQKVNSHA
ncbi:MAG: alanine--tRNA ligase [Candidatus Micrarchaeia archaeon]